jgi:uncharacterized protein
MRYDNKDEQSENVEDRRGQGGGGGMGIPLPMGGGKGGLGLMSMLIIGAIMLLMGKNPLDILMGGGPDMPNLPQMPRMDNPSQRGPSMPGLPGGGGRVPASAQQDEMKTFVSRVLKDTEDVWQQNFSRFGRQYTPAPLVLFSGATRTGCGTGQAAMGPFYCPADQKIYIDLDFYAELKNKFGAPGDFAQAYVIAHEVGHHVQNLLGIADKVQAQKSRMSQAQSNHMQVLMELQADCFAGVWAAQNHQLKNRMERGDIEEGLNAAARIGDDTLQRQATGRVVPEAFTHGSAAQRVKWFRRGMETGQIQQCDTFNAQDL